MACVQSFAYNPEGNAKCFETFDGEILNPVAVDNINCCLEGWSLSDDGLKAACPTPMTSDAYTWSDDEMNCYVTTTTTYADGSTS